MSKRTAAVVLTVVVLVLVTLVMFIFPLNGQDSFQIGKSNSDFYWVSKSIKLGLDLEGGMYAIFEADLSEFPSSTADEAKAAIEGTIANLSNLLFSKGYTEATVTRQGDDRIRVEVPSVRDTEQLMALLGEPAVLEFKDPDEKVVITGGKHLSDAFATYYEGQYAISLRFNEEGTKAFAEATAANVGKQISIWINGQKVMSPTVNAAISDGNAVITGNYDYATANDMAVKLKAGTFAVKLTPQQISTISPSLGQDALKYGVMAGGIGLLLVILIMLVIYRGMGVASALALMVYTTLLLYFLALVPWVQLTLPGIAGVILSIGMAVDANVIIFERIKDERRTGKGIPSSVNGGFKKALVAIIDSNITTILGAIVMIIFGSSAIQSFAITLLIGVLLSMFTAIFVTSLFLNISLAFNDNSEIYYALKLKEEPENV